MTAEQNEQWKKAVNPLSYLDFHALSEAGLLECAQHLAARGVPGWAIQLRAQYISLGWEAHETWVPEFALRCETALIGLQVRHPNSRARGGVYRRVLLRFFHEALRPFVEWAAEGDEKRGKAYHHIIKAYTLFENLERSSEVDYRTWNEVWYKASNLEEGGFWSENSFANSLVSTMLYSWGKVVFHPIDWETWWHELEVRDVASLTDQLNRQHQWRVEGDANSASGSYFQLTAQTFLSALEAECPPPDWLPQT